VVFFKWPLFSGAWPDKYSGRIDLLDNTADKSELSTNGNVREDDRKLAENVFVFCR